MQPAVLTQDQLISLIYLLKESLVFFDKKCYPRITFFNKWSLYTHIRNCDLPDTVNKKRTNSNIGTLLDILEPYIPFTLTDENYDMFMEAVLSPQNVSPQFTHKAKLDFCLALRKIHNINQWEQTLAACESIRALRGELMEYT